MIDYIKGKITEISEVVDVKNNEILPFAPTWVDLENIMLSEISQRQFYIMSLICRI